NGAQVPAAPALLAEISPTPRIKAELFTSTVEINTDIHRETLTCMDELTALHQQVGRQLRKQDAALLSSGTHPFSRWQEQQVSDAPRYQQLMQRLCWTARRFNIFGIHVHLGMPPGDACIATMNRLMPVMPVFLAISANSPFWCGHDTGLSSSRLKIFEGLSQGGMPFYFEDWNDFESCAHRLMTTGSIDSVRDIWWEMRPHPDFGTLEIRMGDMPATRADTRAYIAYVRAEVMAAAHADTGGYRKVHPSLIRENRWRACRYGMAAELIDPGGEKVVPVLDLLGSRLEMLARNGADAADVAIVCRQLSEWRRQGDGAQRQRDIHARQSDWADMIRDMRQDGWNDADAN
ncbi:MAG: YbdK family carboxylate-amine ligase, partial [Mariprofundaceae bacterium]|nr:YbdK family carboxylate-amine ligase [Mariprofundaceae bacterium]